MTSEKYGSYFLSTIQYQEVLFTRIRDGDSIHVELIKPLQARIKSTNFHCKYILFVACACADIPAFSILKDDIFGLQIPLATWNRAMTCAPLSVKRSCKNMTSDDCLEIKFTRNSKTSISIAYLERKQITVQYAEAYNTYIQLWSETTTGTAHDERLD